MFADNMQLIFGMSRIGRDYLICIFMDHNLVLDIVISTKDDTRRL